MTDPFGRAGFHGQLQALGVDPADCSAILQASMSTKWPNADVFAAFLMLLKRGVPVIDVLAAAAMVRSGAWPAPFLDDPYYDHASDSLQFAAMRFVVAVQQFGRVLARAIRGQAGGDA